jgi:hypothetical protein
MAFLDKDNIVSAQSNEQIVCFGAHSQAVMVRAQIHSDRSNMLTMESYPPDARYLLYDVLMIRVDGNRAARIQTFPVDLVQLQHNLRRERLDSHGR